MVAVPYLAWGAELRSDYNERTRITAWREGFGLLGILGAGSLGAVTLSLGWSEKESIGAIAWAAIALGVVVIPLLLWVVPERTDGSEIRNIQTNPPLLDNPVSYTHLTLPTKA